MCYTTDFLTVIEPAVVVDMSINHTSEYIISQTKKYLVVLGLNFLQWKKTKIGKFRYEKRIIKIDVQIQIVEANGDNGDI